jgi:hypothetical protein
LMKNAFHQKPLSIERSPSPLSSRLPRLPRRAVGRAVGAADLPGAS